MAEIIKISELPSQTVFADDDLFATVDTSIAETKKAQLSNIKTYMQGDLNTRLTTAEGEIDTAQTDINNAESVIGNETDTYSASSTYALGSLVIYNSLLYKCTTAITVAEAWNASKWTQMSLTSLIQSNSNYSTTEQAIGTWIDGKPIYRKVLTTAIQTGESNLNRFVTVPLNIPNVKIAWIDKSKSYIVRNNTQYFGIGYGAMLNDETSENYKNYVVDIDANATNFKYYCGMWNVSINDTLDIYVTIEYTKTTD